MKEPENCFIEKGKKIALSLAEEDLKRYQLEPDEHPLNGHMSLCLTLRDTTRKWNQSLVLL